MIYIYHAYRTNFEKNIHIFEDYKNIKISVSNKITIISVMNKECFNNSYLVKQCKTNNIDLIIPNSTFNIESKNWKNTMKIDAIVDALTNIDSDYALILDGKDTCILNNLDETFIKLFEELNCDILYNMQKLPVPNIKFKDYKYPINAGVCFGKRESLLMFYQECKKLNRIDSYIFNNGLPSEQYIIRKAAHTSSLVIKADSEMKLFTCYSEYLNKR